MEGWKVLVDRRTIQKQVTVVADAICHKLKGKDKNVLLCCILKGAAYFTVDLSRALESRSVTHSIYFLEASSYVHQTQQEHVSLTREILPEKFENKHVILLDELYDNGKTMTSVKLLLLEKLGNRLASLTTCVMFRKKKESKYPPPDLVGCDNLPDVWMVGYGLDFKGTMRGSLTLFAVPPPNNEPHALFTDKDILRQIKTQIKLLQ